MAELDAMNTNRDSDADAAHDRLTGRDVAAGAAHTVQLAQVGGPAVQTAAQAVGVAGAAMVAADLARGKDVRAMDVATAAASVTMTAGVGGPAVQAAAKAVAVVGALDAGKRALNTAGDALGRADEVKAMLKNPLLPEEHMHDMGSQRAIDGNRGIIAGTARDSLGAERAREMAWADAGALRGIQDKDLRQAAVVAMGANASSQSEYKAALMREAPDLAMEVGAAPGGAPAARAGKDEYALDAPRKGAVLAVPNRITQAYTERDGKFFDKTSSAMVFQDKGDKLSTSTTDKAAIADMVSYAKAKQWESFKLTGSQEFKREAWLQAESQGIKTQGYTPRENDLAALRTLTLERAASAEAPVAQRKAPERPEQAPRHDLNKNQAASASAAARDSTTNIQQMQKDPAFNRYSMGEMTKIVFYRALVVERDKGAPQDVREAAVAKFDQAMQNPSVVKSLPEPAVKAEHQQAATVSGKSNTRDTSDMSL